MADTTIASLMAIIGADVSGLRRGLSEARGGLDGLAGKLDGIGGKISEFGLRLTGLTGPIRQAFGLGLNIASSYEDSMAEIGARTGATATEMTALDQAARQLGQTMPGITSQDVLQGFLELTTGGMSFAEAMIAIQPTMTGAVAGSQGLGDAANDLTDALNIFKWEAEDAGLMIDFMTQAAGASSATMPELWDAVVGVGPVAQQMGVDFYETVSVMSLFADAGIRGAEAGTQLRSMLTHMASGTETAEAAWAKLGTSFYDAEGNARGLSPVLEDIKAGLAGMTTKEQAAIIKDLAGAYGQVGLSILTASDSLPDVGANIDDQAGAMEVAAAKTDTYSGAMEGLAGSLETLAGTVLTPFMDDVLKPLLQTLTDVVTQVTAWAEENPGVTNAIIALGGAISVIGLPLFLFGTALKVVSGVVAVGGTLVTGLWAVGGALWGLLGPIGVVGLAVAGLTAAFVALLNKTDAFKADQPTLVGLATDLKGSLDAAGRAAELITVGAGGEVGRTGVSGTASATGPAAGETVDDFFRRESEGGAMPAFGGGQASGGPVRGGTMYLVGEMGPELFMPRESGTIVPNDMLRGGGGNTYITLNAHGVSDPVQLVDMVDRELRRRNR